MNMLYFVIFLALIGFGAVMFIRSRANKQPPKKPASKQASDLKNPFK